MRLRVGEGFSCQVERPIQTAHGGWVSEWICLEHTSWVKRKAEQWWKARSPDQVPDSVQRAADLADAGALAPTAFVTVRSVVGEKFERIIAYQLGPKPEACEVWGKVDLDDVPF